MAHDAVEGITHNGVVVRITDQNGVAAQVDDFEFEGFWCYTFYGVRAATKSMPLPIIYSASKHEASNPKP